MLARRWQSAAQLLARWCRKSWILAIGTVITLSAFYYTVPPESPRARIVALSATAGHWLLMIAFGFFFASAVQSYLSALNERLDFVIRFFGLAG